MPDLGETQLLHHGGRPGGWGSLGWWDAAPDTLDTPDTPDTPDRRNTPNAPYAPDGPIDYHSACTALARHVACAAGLSAGARVLSVACGDGEELRLWAQCFGAGTVVGVELDAVRVQRARAATAALAGVRVLQGSGDALLTLGLPDASFDHVLCVDAAYHLQPRTAFLQAAFKLLRPGGTLAYNDLLIDGSGSRWRHTALALGARLCGLPAGSLCDGPAQRQRLHQIGFVELQLQRVDDAVLGGFTRFVAQQGRRLPGGPWQAGWRRVALTAMLIPPCRAAGLGYAMLSARKPLATGAAATAAASASATANAERTALSSSGTPSSA